MQAVSVISFDFSLIIYPIKILINTFIILFFNGYTYQAFEIKFTYSLKISLISFSKPWRKKNISFLFHLTFNSQRKIKRNLILFLPNEK